MTACARPGDLNERDLRGTISLLETEVARLTDLVERLSIDLGIRDGRIVGGQLVIPEHRQHLCRTSYLIGYADAIGHQKAMACSSPQKNSPT